MSNSIKVLIIVIAVGAAAAIYLVPRPELPIEPNQPQVSDDMQALRARIINGFRAEATKEERKEYFNFVASLGEDTKEVEVGYCELYPLVPKFKKGSKIMFLNGSDAPRTISFTTGYNFVVEAGKSKAVVFDFLEYAGVHFIDCDFKRAGAVFMTD